MGGGKGGGGIEGGGGGREGELRGARGALSLMSEHMILFTILRPHTLPSNESPWLCPLTGASLMQCVCVCVCVCVTTETD